MKLIRSRCWQPCTVAVLSILLFGKELPLAAQTSGRNPDPQTADSEQAAEPVAAIARSTGNPNNNVAGPEIPSAQSSRAAEIDSSQTRLGPGDLIEISVYNVPELSTKARIGSSGDVYLPLIDYIHLADDTIDEAQAAIQKRLEEGGFVRDAHVSILVDQSASQRVTILGEVARPGIYPAGANMKLYDCISAAGGFTASAGRNISVIRRQGETSRAITLDLPRSLAEDLKDNINILPGDTIGVPRAPIIYVVGDVGHPAGLLIDNGKLTVLQAIALAGGTNRTAKMSGVRIIRKGPSGMTETRVPLKKMLEAKAPDVLLQADDILFIPLSGARFAAAQGLQAVVTATTGIAIVAAHP